MRIAYPKSELSDARYLLGDFFNIAVNTYHLYPDKAYEIFLVSRYSKLIEKGNIAVISGKSGYELFYDVMSEVFETFEILKEPHVRSNTQAFWGGWMLAYLQWSTARSFDNIQSIMPFSKIMDMYTPYHEMDDRHFLSDILERYFYPKTNLFRIRKRNHLSQKELAKRANVSIRTIQMLEQKHNDVNQVKAINLFNMARALHCSMEELMD